VAASVTVPVILPPTVDCSGADSVNSSETVRAVAITIVRFIPSSLNEVISFCLSSIQAAIGTIPDKGAEFQ
jgi:hypothetical protein